MRKTYLPVLKNLGTVLAGFFLLAACSFGSDSSGGSASSVSTPLAVTFTVSEPAADASMPAVDLTAYSYSISAVSASATTVLLEKESVSSDDLSNQQLSLSAEIPAGSYTFTVTAYSGSTAVLAGSASATIAKAGKSVSLSLAALTGGSGDLSVTLHYASVIDSATVAKVSAGVYDTIPSSASALESASGSASVLTVSEGSGDDAYNTVCYENDSVASGAIRYVVFFLYDSSDSLITSYPVAVYIISGLTTSAEETIDGLTGDDSEEEEDSSEDEDPYIVGDGGTIDDSAVSRTNSLAITSSDTPTGYASVDWTAPSYTTVTVSTRSDLIRYAKAGGYFIIVDGMIDLTDQSSDGSGSMLPAVGGGTTTALDAFVAANSDYTGYRAFVSAYAASCSTTTDDSSSSSPESSVGASLWTLNTAYKNIVQVTVASSTAIVGADASSGIRGGTLSLSGVDHVVIRNMIIQDAYDPFPHHEDSDGYNGERDGITIQGASSHIWIDHCTFGDTLTPDHVLTGGSTTEKWQTYDGLLDIKGDGAYITVSSNIFKNHDKTSLIGSGDSEGSNSTRKITYHHNYFYNCGQRQPMVRNTTLHVYNNVYAYDSGAYSQQYAIGPRKNVIIYAENNYFGSGISYAFKGKDAAAIYASGNVRNNGSNESEENVNYSGVSVSGSTLFSDSTNGAPAAYSYTLESVSAITDSSSGVAATSGSGDATINGNTYGSSL